MALDRDKLYGLSLEVVQLLMRKNNDYGSSYFELRDEYGYVAFLVRLADKFARLKHLAENKPAFEDESVEDTLKDIVGYCLLELYYQNFVK
jgi:hypothetical protein